jgi:hypothetical protein
MRHVGRYARPMGRARHALPVFLAAVFAGLAVAPAAWAGQIVWSARDAIWSMGDDGSSPHRLIGGHDARLAGLLPQGVLSSPDVFQAAGATVLFLGSTSAFAPLANPGACGQGCTDTFALRAGGLVDLGPAPGPLAGAAYRESQPRLTADGQELFGRSAWSSISAGAAGSARADLAERAVPSVPSIAATTWSNTAAGDVSASGFDGATDPADPTEAAWVDQQGCGNYTLNGMPACQFAVRVGARAATAGLVSIYDDEYAGATGTSAGPTSLDWSPDGSQLLMVDPFAPNDGIYEFAATTAATAGKPVTEVLAQPAGWSFNQARFAGTIIVFDAHRGSGATQTGDIFTIPASCTAATCSFPASATNLTNDPPADAADPAWTSTSTALAPFDGTVLAGASGTARATAARLQPGPVRAGHPVAMLVTLDAAATIIVTITPRRAAGGRPPALGSASFRGAAGVNRIRIRRIAGGRLGAGGYRATIRAQGSAARPISLSFAVAG